MNYHPSQGCSKVAIVQAGVTFVHVCVCLCVRGAQVFKSKLRLRGSTFPLPVCVCVCVPTSTCPASRGHFTQSVLACGSSLLAFCAHLFMRVRNLH